MNITEQIDKIELIQLEPRLIILEDKKIDWDTLGYALDRQIENAYRETSNQEMSFSLIRIVPQQYWNKVKEEFRLLICTKDKKYTKLRNEIKKHKGKATTLILTSITAYLAPIIGAPLAALTPFVAVILYGIAEVGTNAWCGIQNPNK